MFDLNKDQCFIVGCALVGAIISPERWHERTVAAHAGRRIFAAGHRTAGVVNRLDQRDDDAVSAAIERLFQLVGPVVLHPDHRHRRRLTNHPQDVAQRLHIARGMLHVDAHPVEAGARHGRRHQRIGRRGPCSVDGLASMQALLQIRTFHAFNSFAAANAA